MLEEHGAPGLVLVWAREVLRGLHHVAKQVASAGLGDFEIGGLVEEGIELGDGVALDAPVIRALT